MTTPHHCDDADAAPKVERTRHNVRTFADLRVGDVIRSGGRPFVLTRIEPADRTILDLIDHPDWGAAIADPSQVDIWGTYPPSNAVRRGHRALPIHQPIGWTTLVAVGPDAHY